MDEPRFRTELENFVRTYPSEGWELKETPDGIYAFNGRRVIPAQFRGLQVFANYYINRDQIFRVPVFSATFYTEDGRQLTFTELAPLLPEKLDGSAISEREHELTGYPVFFIHPCKTDELIAPFVALGANYLHCWLVRYGPVFFYRLPFAPPVPTAPPA
jgi:hypothetical protein